MVEEYRLSLKNSMKVQNKENFQEHIIKVILQHSDITMFTK